MGTCTGVVSSCALAGYAMESRCHLGRSVVYDTVRNLSWSVGAHTHGIVRVIEEVLGAPWADAQARGREVPEARGEDEECEATECYSWEFGEYPAPPPKEKGTAEDESRA
jgi:lipase ATG15